MRIALCSIFLLFSCISLSAQDLSGQWKGEFIEKSTSINGWGGDKCEYVLDLECRGRAVSGFSYTYFTDGGKRYYTICRLVGFVDKKKKYIEVTEVERTKTNVPVEVRNCFQVHKLSYAKLDNNEVLEGNWIPAPRQDGSCGHGVTSLMRRALKNSFPDFNAAANKPKLPARSTGSVKPKAKTPPKNATARVTPKAPLKPVEKTITLSPNKDSFEKTESAAKNPSPKLSPPPFFEKRNTSILKTIEVENSTVRVDLYDNGEVDGDSISLLYNNRLLVSHKRLSEKALTLNIELENEGGVNELVMYAENLGSIPPNTALMVVTDGFNRYEVRITSDLQKNGTIRFVHRPKVSKQ